MALDAAAQPRLKLVVAIALAVTDCTAAGTAASVVTLRTLELALVPL